MLRSVLTSFRSWFKNTPPFIICLMLFMNRYFWDLSFALTFISMIIMEEITEFLNINWCKKKYFFSFYFYVCFSILCGIFCYFGNITIIITCCVYTGSVYALITRKYTPFEMMIYRFLFAKLLTTSFS
jgi:hypothetical protein